MRASLTISILSLVVSLFSVVFTFLSYNLEKRPYVGITKVEHQPIGTPKIEALEWRIVFQNTGSLPANVIVEGRKVSVTYKEKKLEVRLQKLPGEITFLVMPGAEVTLNGDYPKNDRVPVSAIITGEVVLEDYIRISYSPSGAVWWKSRYYYEATLRFLSTGKGPRYSPYFAPIHASAN